MSSHSKVSSRWLDPPFELQCLPDRQMDVTGGGNEVLHQVYVLVERYLGSKEMLIKSGITWFLHVSSQFHDVVMFNVRWFISITCLDWSDWDHVNHIAWS